MRHWTFWEWVAYAALFVAAMIVAADTEVRIPPDLAPILPSFMHGAVWGFAPLALVILATVILLGREWFGRKSGSLTPIAIHTSLRLQFNAGTVLPTALDMNNIWRWYTLTHILLGIDKEGKIDREHRLLTIFVMFDHSITFKQITLDSGGAVLPLHEIKDSSPRHAIITLQDAIPGVVLEIKAII